MPLTFPDAALLLANDYQARPDERRTHPAVQSRMLLWCRTGRGRIIVNGTRMDVEPDDLFWLPWGRRITYISDARQPFVLGGLHIIPIHDRDRPLAWQVPHEPEAPHTDASYRRDAEIPGAEGIRRGYMRDNPALRPLADYAIAAFQRTEKPEPLFRQLGQMLLEEIRQAFQSHGQHAPRPLPRQLRKLCDFIREHLDASIAVEDLADLADRSESWVTRNFRKHLGMPPNRYILACRIDAARRLLATTALPVGEVGRRCGFSDPYYFSKCFRRETNETPSAYRRRSSLVP